MPSSQTITPQPKRRSDLRDQLGLSLLQLLGILMLVGVVLAVALKQWA